MVSDLKEALERLNQNPSNSSRPSGSLAPWEKGMAGDEDEESNSDENAALRSKTSPDQEASPAMADTVKEDSPQPETTQDTNGQSKPGRQLGSQGFGRSQKLAITDTLAHSCGCCSACDEDLTLVEQAYTGFQTVNVVVAIQTRPAYR